MTEKMITTFITLVLVIILTRIGPLSVERLLKNQPWMQAIANQLPCMILILLLFHDTETRIVSNNVSILSIVIGIITTLSIHQWKRQSILSIAAGVAAYAISSLFI